MKKPQNLGYTPTKLLEFAANHNYISKSESSDDISVGLKEKNPSPILRSKDDITLGSKDKTLDLAKDEYLNLSAKEKAKCHLEWFFSLTNEEKQYFSKNWEKGQGVSPNPLEMGEVLKEVYPKLAEKQQEDLIKRFKSDDYCGIGLKKEEMIVALGSSAESLQKEFKIENENISVGDKSISGSAYKALLFLAVFLNLISREVAAQCNGDPNIVCPPTFSPTLNPSIFPTLFPTLNPTLAESLMPTLSPSTLIPTILNTLASTNSPTNPPSPSPSISPSMFPSIATNDTVIYQANSENDQWWDPDKPYVYLLGAGIFLTICGGAISYLCCRNNSEKVIGGVDEEETYEKKQTNAGVRAEKLDRRDNRIYNEV